MNLKDEVKVCSELNITSTIRCPFGGITITFYLELSHRSKSAYNEIVSTIGIAIKLAGSQLAVMK